MKTRFGIVFVVAIIAAIFVFQPVMAQEGCGCGKSKVKGEASSCGDEEHGMAMQGEEPNQEKWPAMGNKINKDVYADYDGKRVYFCCAGCNKAFMKDPDKYLGEMKEAGVVLAATPCPVTGKPSNPEVFAEYNEKKVYFCCPGCKTKFMASPDEYLDK